MAKEAAMTPRQRQRQRTMAKIVASASTRVKTDTELTMRAVAHDVGLTGPGLYRYVNSIAELHLLVIHTSIGSAVDSMRRVKDDYADPGEQLVAGAAALRTWALSHPTEFRLAFASHRVHEGRTPEELEDLATRLGADHLHSSRCIGDFFAPVFAELTRQKPHLTPVSVFEQFADEIGEYPIQLRYSFLSPEHSPTIAWSFLYLWARLYGIIAFEVFNNVPPTVVASALMFRTTLCEMTEKVGSQMTRERVREIIDSEITRCPSLESAE